MFNEFLSRNNMFLASTATSMFIPFLNCLSRSMYVRALNVGVNFFSYKKCLLHSQELHLQDVLSLFLLDPAHGVLQFSP